jgi:porin
MGWYSVGFAYKDQDLAAIDGTTADDDSAFWANFNQWVYQDHENPHRSISVFGRVGITDGEVNPIENHYSLGVSFDGMIGSRTKDRLGIVGWYNEFSSDFSPTFDDSSSGFEAYYSFQVTPWLQFGPDIQYLIDPGLHAGEDDTTVMGARALIHF